MKRKPDRKRMALGSKGMKPVGDAGHGLKAAIVAIVGLIFGLILLSIMSALVMLVMDKSGRNQILVYTRLLR